MSFTDAPRVGGQSLPKCWRKRPTSDNKRRQCRQPAAPVWVVGSFGRMASILCNRCIEEVRRKGWKVTYQLEGDNPAGGMDITTPEAGGIDAD